MKIINVVVIIAMLWVSVGFASAVTFFDMDNIITDNCTPRTEFRIIGSYPTYICDLYINDIPSGMVIVDNNVLSSIVCNMPLEVGLYEYYISTYIPIEMRYYNSSCYNIQITLHWYDRPVEAIGYISDGFQHIADSTESLFLWGIIFCAIVILLGIIGMFIKALRG